MNAHKLPSRLPTAGFTLLPTTLGALPMVNHFLDRLGIDGLLEHYVPLTDQRCHLAPAKALGLLLRNFLIARAPIYALEEWAAPFDPVQLRRDTASQ
jgi:Domain of unknown function (DUF4277)